jgi:hypothetical protein
MASAHSQTVKKLAVLKETLCKLDADPEKTPAMLDLRRILLERIKEIEAQIKAQRHK